MLRYLLNNESEPNSSFTAEKYVDHSFPLAFVQPAIPAFFLYKAYKEGMERRKSASCFGSTGTDGRCMACGAYKATRAYGQAFSHHLSPVDIGSMEKRILLEVQVWYKQDLQSAMFSITGGQKLDISYLIPTESDRFSISVCITRLGEQ